MSDLLNNVKEAFKSRLSAILDPTNPQVDYAKLTMRINECIRSFPEIFLSHKLYGNNRKNHFDSKDIHEFAALVENAMAEQQSVENIPDRDKVILRKAFTPNQMDNPCITWKVKNRKHGSFSQHSIHEDSKVREYSYHLREVVDDADDLGYTIWHYGQFMDNHIEFKIHANESPECDRLALWFENLMENFKWYFSLEGINRVFLLERQEEQYFERAGNFHYSIPMVYLVRTEKALSLKHKNLENIIINLCVKQ